MVASLRPIDTAKPPRPSAKTATCTHDATVRDTEAAASVMPAAYLSCLHVSRGRSSNFTCSEMGMGTAGDRGGSAGCCCACVAGCSHFPCGQVAAGIVALIESAARLRPPHSHASQNPIPPGSVAPAIESLRFGHALHASRRAASASPATGPWTMRETSAFRYCAARFTIGLEMQTRPNSPNCRSYTTA
jgi:hypothetical protein